MLPTLLELLRVVAHTLIIYLFLIACFRFLGRRQISQLTTTELAIIMILGSSVETAMVAGDVSLPAGLVSAGTLLASNRALSLGLSRWRWLRRFVIGRPLLLVHQGRLLGTHLQEAGLTEADVREAVREHGYGSLDEIRFAVLEIDGSVGVVPVDTASEPDGKGRSPRE